MMNDLKTVTCDYCGLTRPAGKRRVTHCGVPNLAAVPMHGGGKYGCKGAGCLAPVNENGPEARAEFNRVFSPKRDGVASR